MSDPLLSLDDVTRPLRELVPEGADVRVTDLTYDSRAVRPGALFFCVRGSQHDGHGFAADAVRRGAGALIVERTLSLGVPEVRVPDVRAAMAPIAARFYGQPSEDIDVVGVTGTNGKTTTTFLLRSILAAAGTQCGLLGTIKTVIGGREVTPSLTTPEAIDLQRALREMADAGDRACAMEVSSHGLALRRVDGVRFRAAVFTNLSRDHLDFHRSMPAYFGAKRQLFTNRPGLAIVNADDAYGRVLAQSKGTVTYGLDRPADYRGSDVHTSLAGSRFVVETGGRRVRSSLSLPGKHNVANALAALAAAAELGVDIATACEALAEFDGVPGRLQSVEEGQPFHVFVDFAHTPDGLARSLETARELASGRVLCTFGCAGGRDPGTRAPMGAIATALADEVVLTTDDPRGECPQAIIDDIRQGADGSERVILDREAAIRWAVEQATAGDVVLVAGRGHEITQTLNGRTRRLDDVAVARRALRRRLAKTPQPTFRSQ